MMSYLRGLKTEGKQGSSLSLLHTHRYTQIIFLSQWAVRYFQLQFIFLISWRQERIFQLFFFLLLFSTDRAEPTQATDKYRF